MTNTRVAIVNDYELVVMGLHRMLEDAEAFDIVELDTVVDPTMPVDMALFDSFGAEAGPGPDLLALLANPRVGKVVVYTWNTDPSLVQLAAAAGVAGYLSKELRREELVDALERIASGQQVFATAPVTTAEPSVGDWPGRHLGLSARESEVLGLIVQGLSNEQIAQRVFVSMNSVKTYIRGAYRKLGLRSRTQAILWGVENGFLPRARVIRPTP